MNTRRFTKITVSKLIDSMVCETPVEDCFLGICDQCNSITPLLLFAVRQIFRKNALKRVKVPLKRHLNET